MKKLQLAEMEEISAAFNWREFVKGTCEGAAFGLSLVAMPLGLTVAVGLGGTFGCGLI
ncbi:hypothetical protein [Niabella aquatica]